MNLHSARARLGIITVAGVLAVGCAPLTNFRRAALVGAPTGESLITPVRGMASIEGSVSHAEAGYEQLPDVGDSALRVAETQFAGRVRLRLGRYATLGLEGTVGHESLSDPNAFGTPPLDDEFVFSLGPNVAFHFGDPDRWLVMTSLAINFASVPWATYMLDESPSTPLYTLVDEGKDTQVLARLSAGAIYIPHPAVELFGGISLQNVLSNEGFSNQPADGSTIFSTFGAVPFLGVTGRIPGGVFVQIQGFIPIGYGDALRADATGGVHGTIGVQFGEDYEPEPEPAALPATTTPPTVVPVVQPAQPVQPVQPITPSEPTPRATIGVSADPNAPTREGVGAIPITDDERGVDSEPMPLDLEPAVPSEPGAPE